MMGFTTGSSSSNSAATKIASTVSTSSAKASDRAVSRDPGLVLLALKTLGALTLPGTTLIRLVEMSVLPYLDAEDVRVREAAATTCASMILSLMVKTPILKLRHQSQIHRNGASEQGHDDHGVGADDEDVFFSKSSASLRPKGCKSPPLDAATDCVSLRDAQGQVTPRYSSHGAHGNAMGGVGQGHSGHSNHDLKMLLLPPISESTEQPDEESPRPGGSRPPGASSTPTSTSTSNQASVGTARLSQTPPRSQLRSQLQMQEALAAAAWNSRGMGSSGFGTIMSDKIGTLQDSTAGNDRLGATTTRALGKAHIYTRGPTAIAIDRILSRLLEVVVTDPHQEVRLCALRCLVSSADFDKYLEKAHHIETLIFLLADEHFDIKIEALRILSRLSYCNPSVVLPPLRLLLIRLTSEMKNAADNRLREEATLMLSRFLQATALHSIAKPYVGTLIRLLPLHGKDVRLTTAALECIGEICKVMKQDITPYSDQLMPLIITNMHDHSSRRKQEMSVRTLGQLISATGQVVRPYLHYPELLPKALDLLFLTSLNTPWSLRMEVLRTLGLLGALEPQKFTLIENHLQQVGKTRAEKATSDELTARQLLLEGGPGGSGKGPGGYTDEKRRDRSDSFISGNQQPNSRDGGSDTGDAQQRTRAAAGAGGGGGVGIGTELIQSEVLLEDDHADAPAHLFTYSQCVMRSLSVPTVKEESRRTPMMDDYYPRIAFTALMKILRDKSLNLHHSSVAQAIMYIFKSLGMRCVPYLEEVVPFLLQIVRVCGPGLRESLLQQLAQLVAIVRYHITVYLPGIFDIVRDYWDEHLEHILCLVEEIALTAADAFSPYVTVVLPLLLASLSCPRGVSQVAFKQSGPGSQV